MKISKTIAFHLFIIMAILFSYGLHSLNIKDPLAANVVATANAGQSGETNADENPCEDDPADAPENFNPGLSTHYKHLFLVKNHSSDTPLLSIWQPPKLSC